MWILFPNVPFVRFSECSHCGNVSVSFDSVSSTLDSNILLEILCQAAVTRVL